MLLIMLRTLMVILIFLLPHLLSGMMPGGPVHIIKPELPDSLKGIQLSLEVRCIQLFKNGPSDKVYVLSANLLNRNSVDMYLSIRYSYGGDVKVKSIEISANQQRIFLLDRHIPLSSHNTDIKMLYSQVELDFSYEPENFSRVLTIH